jgi:hypothetical protein
MKRASAIPIRRKGSWPAFIEPRKTPSPAHTAAKSMGSKKYGSGAGNRIE